MSDLDTRELKPVVPALDFARSKRFYLDLGFICAWSNARLAEFRHGTTAFLLQDDYMAVVAENTVLVLCVTDVDAWWQHVHDARLVDIYGVRQTRIERQEAGRREFSLTDPSGVLWRIAQHPPAR